MAATRVWMAGMGLVPLVLLTGCSGAAGGASDGSFGEISGTPVSVQSELTALCAEIVEQALPVDVALVLAESNGYVAAVAGDASAGAVEPGAGEATMVLTVSGDVVVGCEARA